MFASLKTVAAACACAAFTAACGGAVAGTPSAVGTAAPEFAGIDQWINSQPLTVKQSHGKVVLVDFWTYSCINCVHTLPYVKSWYHKYKDQGLVVIGVHTPEYAFERVTGNVKTAIRQYGIDYPVAQDNQYATWNAYDNQYWPGFYLIDRNGQIAYSHFGEGDYAQTEAKIASLLAQKG